MKKIIYLNHISSIAAKKGSNSTKKLSNIYNAPQHTTKK